MVGISKKLNLENIEKRIETALQSVGRSRNEITLIAVSKLQSLESIKELHQAGVKNFGENYLQEASAKLESLKDLKIHWHFIGQIQSKKAKDLVGKFSYIHSVDRLKVAEILNTVAMEKQVRQKILVEVNLAGETSKGGVPPQEAENFVKELAMYKNLQVCGLMVMPPMDENPERLRPYFAQAKTMLTQLQSKKLLGEADNNEFKQLSMGTSQDFHVAIEEGATMIRVGTVLFGPRPEKKDLQ